ncbi:selenide, water dikinase SelD [Spirochaeta isovalerica]|uniref:Selenide, water dikinase n=1 Tax=Spirochaeta isovalerica TaxID=150 RepID=A0A841R891_9SPIO|nr:selenide, water dikinase SelD [Spirochaeta isovalerica]MBB6479581.1 selenide,water dikinase [Spirochaeta isovalerica]
MDNKLTQFTKFSGCGAKLGPALLDKALCGLQQPKYENMISDFSTSDDAGVYRINDETALIQTVDFFPPIVDDPYVFGQIAAANSLSDVYAMGARPITALSLVCFPKDKSDIETLRAMMDGGLSKLIEAETALLGGHSIEDDELKFGFSVTGTVHPDKVLYNNRPKKNEALILTKPLGTGLINTALRGGIASERAIEAFTESMRTLNKIAAEVIYDYNVSSCTDVTGFGLAGHACEMIADSEVGLSIDMKKLKLLPDVAEYASMGLIPAGTYRNRDFRLKFINNSESLSRLTLDLIFDPQTSGGLFFSVAQDQADELLGKLISKGVPAQKIGNTQDKPGIEIIE